MPDIEAHLQFARDIANALIRIGSLLNRGVQRDHGLLVGQRPGMQVVDASELGYGRPQGVLNDLGVQALRCTLEQNVRRLAQPLRIISNATTADRMPSIGIHAEATITTPAINAAPLPSMSPMT